MSSNLANYAISVANAEWQNRINNINLKTPPYISATMRMSDADKQQFDQLYFQAYQNLSTGAALPQGPSTAIGAYPTNSLAMLPMESPLLSILGVITPQKISELPLLKAENAREISSLSPMSKSAVMDLVLSTERDFKNASPVVDLITQNRIKVNIARFKMVEIALGVPAVSPQSSQIINAIVQLREIESKLNKAAILTHYSGKNIPTEVFEQALLADDMQTRIDQVSAIGFIRQLTQYSV